MGSWLYKKCEWQCRDINICSTNKLHEEHEQLQWQATGALHGFDTFSCFPDHSRYKSFFMIVTAQEDMDILQFGLC